MSQCIHVCDTKDAIRRMRSNSLCVTSVFSKFTACYWYMRSVNFNILHNQWLCNGKFTGELKFTRKLKKIHSVNCWLSRLTATSIVLLSVFVARCKKGIRGSDTSAVLKSCIDVVGTADAPDANASLCFAKLSTSKAGLLAFTEVNVPYNHILNCWIYNYIQHGAYGILDCDRKNTFLKSQWRRWRDQMFMVYLAYIPL